MGFSRSISFWGKGNKTNHFFTNTKSLFKDKGGFYSVGQILAIKDKGLDFNSTTNHRSNNII
jgi:hypothetical protein